MRATAFLSPLKRRDERDDCPADVATLRRNTLEVIIVSTILVVDDMAVFREPIAMALRVHGFETYSAQSAREALTLLESRRFDLILLDISMPDMDGLTCLRRIRSNSEWQRTPVILLTAVAEREFVMEACRLGVEHYLVKSSFSLDELVTHVRRCTSGNRAHPEVPGASGTTPDIASHNHKTTLQPSFGKTLALPPGQAKPLLAQGIETHRAEPQPLLQRLRSSPAIKTLPGAVLNILGMTNSAKSNSDELAAELGRDPVLASRVLQVANSAVYARSRGPVTNLSQAVLTLGLSTVRNITLTVGLFESIPMPTRDGYSAVRCWEHCIAVARLIDLMIPDESIEQKSMGYLIGLCHDLPEIMLRSELGSEYSEVSELSAESGMPFGEALELLLGVKYQQVASTVLQGLGLPTAIRKPVEEYLIASAERSDATRALGRIPLTLRLSNWFAHGLLLGPSSGCDLQPVSSTEFRRAFGTSSPPSIDWAEFRGRVQAEVRALSRPSAREELALSSGAVSRLPGTLLYLRDRSLSEFDPLGVALPQLVTSVAEAGLELSILAGREHDGAIIAPGDGEKAKLTLGALRKLSLSPNHARRPVILLVNDPELCETPPAGVEIATLPLTLQQLHHALRRILVERPAHAT